MNEARMVLLRVELYDLNGAIDVLDNSSGYHRYAIKLLQARTRQIAKEINYEKQRRSNNS
jgi:hypothetical protein